MSETYWPNDAVGNNALRLTALPFWYVTEFKGPDRGLFDPPESPSHLRLVGEGET